MSGISVRRANEADIASMHRIRLAVRENALSAPSRMGEDDYLPFLKTRGRTWVAEARGRVAGFAALDFDSASLWALFVDPGMEARGVGSRLLDLVETYARRVGLARIGLSTGPGTRAEKFYERRGWRRCGLDGSGEIVFELKLATPNQATAGDS